MTLDYHVEFPDFGDLDVPLPTNAVVTDISWCNDICPSFIVEQGKLSHMVFVDYIDPTRREYPECTDRFTVTSITDTEDGLARRLIYSGNDWAFVMELVAPKHKSWDSYALARWSWSHYDSGIFPWMTCAIHHDRAYLERMLSAPGIAVGVYALLDHLGNPVARFYRE